MKTPNRLDTPMRIRPVLIVGLEGTVRRSISGATFPTSLDDIELLPNIEHQILKYKELGYLVLLIAQDNRISLGLKKMEEVNKEIDKTISLFKTMPFNDIKIQYCNSRGTVPQFTLKSMNELPKIGALAVFEKDALTNRFIIDWNKSIFVGCTELEMQTAENAGIKFVETGVFLTSVIASGPDTPNPNLN